jgi:SAM-dependent methyltransferase
MLTRITELIYRSPQHMKNLFQRPWYETMSVIDRDADMIFMNYGWASLEAGPQPLMLRPQDETDRYCIQLYHHVAAAVDLSGRDVLEVGSGRGGGASYVARCLAPRSMTGLELASRAVAFCQQHYAHVPNLRFVPGSAEDIQFPDESLDAVINIESSHCYNHIDRFFSGVYRVLRPGGHFLYSDHRLAPDVDGLRRKLLAPGFQLLDVEDISPNVVRALELDDERKRALIEQKVPRLLRNIFHEFAGMQGSRSQYSALRSGKKRYIRFLLQKPEYPGV